MILPHRFSLVDNYSQDQIIELIKQVEKLLNAEESLIEVPEGKTMIVGDLHGDLDTLKKIVQIYFRKKFKNLVFLGDYVDRGAKQVEVVNVLFYYKNLYPEKIFLLRGNHEDPIINSQYGFYDELRLKFKDYKTMFQYYNYLFSKLPIAAITWNRIFCVHAGIPEGLDLIEDINQLPPKEQEISHPITTQLLWNDPKEKIDTFTRSTRGTGIKNFGKEAFNEFIERNQIRSIIRSHEKFKNGYKTYFDNKLISIFTSSSYSRRVNTVVGVIDKDGNVEVMQI